MAEFTLRAVLATMQISVTVLAFCRNIAEDEIGMAIAAFHFGMATAQWKSGLRVLKFEFGSKRLPSLRRMTLLAWNLEFVPVRAARGRVRALHRHVRIDWTAHCNTH